MVCIATDSSHTKLPLWYSLNYRCSVPSDVGGSKQNLHTLEPFDHYLNRKWATAFIFFQELLIEVLGSTRVRATICNISCSQTWNRQWTEILCPHLSGKEDQSLDVQYSTLWTHYFSEACRQASLLRWVLGPVVILWILEGIILALVRKELATCSTVPPYVPKTAVIFAPQMVLGFLSTIHFTFVYMRWWCQNWIRS